MAAPPLHVVLVHPEIPPNTGNIGRLCAFAAARLHLIHPLGFRTDDRQLRRSGMDYWRRLDVHEHPSWQSFTAASQGPRRLWLMTAHAAADLWSAHFAADDGLVFGCESQGAPPEVYRSIAPPRRLAIARFGAGLRSLNLATSVAVAVYEARRQQAAAGG